MTDWKVILCFDFYIYFCFESKNYYNGESDRLLFFARLTCFGIGDLDYGFWTTLGVVGLGSFTYYDVVTLYVFYFFVSVVGLLPTIVVFLLKLLLPLTPYQSSLIMFLTSVSNLFLL